MIKSTSLLQVASIVIAATFTFGCVERGHENRSHNKENVGTLAGAGLGAIAGAQFGKGKGQLAGVAVGTMLGAVAGKNIGASLDRADAAYYNRTLNQVLEYNPSGVRSRWKNPDSGNYGEIMPKRTYVERGQDCREYTHTVVIGGQQQSAFGKACRRSNGAWEIVR